MKQFGLIGERLSHSHSKTLHALMGAYRYDLWPMPPEALDAFMTSGAFDGMNVTIPYKQAVIPYLAELTGTAKQIGSVNTVVRRADGTLYGDNTDAYGFLELARRAGIDFREKKTLVLGSGGTSLTACYVIREAGGQPVVISRSGENTYDDIERHADAAFVVNTTPVGMYPNTDASPLDLRRLPGLCGVLDVVYNPLRTRLLQQAQSLHIPCAGGLCMLVYQAARACELFTGESVPAERVKEAERAIRRSVTNVVLVGMPGCGKTTVGNALAKRLQLPVVDVDAEIEREAGKSIPKLFETEGEAGFRKREAAQLARICREGGQIITTGGGAVKREQNCEHMRLNGFVVHITRDMESLALDGRPLSTGKDALCRLWEEREPLYNAVCDVTIQNNTTPEDCAKRIEEAYHEALCD